MAATAETDPNTRCKMLNGLNILYVTHRFPYPPSGGAKVRAFHCLRDLGERNRVVVAAPLRDGEEAEAVPGLKRYCHDVLSAPVSASRAVWQVMTRVATLRPASVGYFHSPELVRKVRRHLANERVDLIIVHCSSVAPYVSDVAEIPKVLDFVDIDSRKWIDYRPYKRFPMSLGYGLEGWTLARLEAALAQRFDLCLAATQFEVDTLRSLAGPVSAAVVNNGVDLDFFSPARQVYDSNLICFVGRMDYYPNEQCMVTFCRDVLPRLRARHPELRLAIVGAAPTSAVRSLADQPGVEVTGTVDDVRPYLRGAALTVAPLRIARGTQNKVLESMALGVPVVASSLAARGVDAIPGEHLLTADGPEESVQAISSLLSDPDRRRRFAQAGRARVELRHSWPGALATFNHTITEKLFTPSRRFAS